jgi:hypothetical protein
MTRPSKGRINIDIKDPVPDWEPYRQPKAPGGAPSVLYVVLDDVGFSAMEPFGGPIETRTSTGSRSAVSRTRTSTRSCLTRSWEARRARTTSLEGCDWTLQSQRLCRSPSWRRSHESPCLAAPSGTWRARSWFWRPRSSAGGIVAATCQDAALPASRAKIVPRMFPDHGGAVGEASLSPSTDDPLSAWSSKA